MRTTTVNESIKVIRQYVGKEVTVRNGDTVEMLRVIGYSVSTMTHTKLLTLIIEDNNGGWTVTKEMIDAGAGEKVYARFIDKGIKARFENTFVIDEFEHLTDTEYIK
ncbi:hypothetical protein PM116P2_00029 [Parabacteroides phage PM116P2]|nr:hypothetical protein PM116P1_00027 [Parabacteroides phage PM116P1]WAX17448.1 hypothetical protein PM116P2_00029 [Parabacteroides phage PM116P2]